MHTSTTWEGVVMVLRPDTTKLPEGAKPMCRVLSARTVQLLGRRAISHEMPYDELAKFFRAGDGDHIFCDAWFKDGYLHIEGRARSNVKEWVVFSMTDAQSGGGVHSAYQ